MIRGAISTLTAVLLVGETPLAAAAAPACKPDIPCVLMFGDSLTAGFGLPPNQGLVRRLSEYLAQNGQRVMLIDAGLSGDTSYGGRVRISASLRRNPGVDGVVVELGANDMLMGFPPGPVSRNLDAILTTAGQGGRKVMLVGIDAPDVLSPRLRQDWAAIWPKLAARHDAALVADIYAPLSAVPLDQRGDLILSDRIHPSAKGVDAIVAHIGPSLVQFVRSVADQP